MKNVTMENIFSLYSDYLRVPKNIDIDYQMNYDLCINKYLSMNIKLHIIADEDPSSELQFKQIFGLGAKYVFHEK